MLEAALGRGAAARLASAAGVRAAGDEIRSGRRRRGGFRRLADYFRASGYGDRHFAVHRGVRRSDKVDLGVRSSAMSSSRRLLIIGGIALAVWGMSYGLWYAVLAEHQPLDNIGASLARRFAAAADRHPSALQASLQQYREGKYIYDRQFDVHGHCIVLAMLLILLGIGSNPVNFSVP